MPPALTVAVLTYLLLRRAFDTGIRGRWQGLGAALLPCSPAVPPRVVWSTWEGEGVAGRRGMGSFVHRQVVRGDKGSCIYGAGGSVSAQYELPFAMRMRTVCIEYIVTISAGTCVVSSRA